MSRGNLKNNTMKTSQKIIIFVIMLLNFLIFCHLSNGQNQILIKRTVYDVPIINATSFNYGEDEPNTWNRENLEPFQLCFLRKNILEKVMSGKLEVYDDNGNKYSLSDADKIIMKRGDTLRMTRTEPAYAEYDTILDMPKVFYYNIKFLRFRESWYYDTKSLKIIKQTNDYAPVVLDTTEKALGKKEKRMPLFWIKCNTSQSIANEFELFSNFISYGCSFISSPEKLDYRVELCNTMQVDIANLDFFDLLIKSVVGGEIKGYKRCEIENYYQYLSDSVEEIKPNEIRKTLTYDYNKQQKTVKGQDVYGMYFYEKWYINKHTLEIIKVVIAMRPILYNSEDYRKHLHSASFDLLFMKPFRCY